MNPDRKSLPMTNTLAYYENPYITDRKSFITLGQAQRVKAHLHFSKSTAKLAAAAAAATAAAPA